MPEPTAIEELEEELNSVDERPSSQRNGTGDHEKADQNNHNDEEIAQKGQGDIGIIPEDDGFEEDEKNNSSGDEGGDQDTAQPVEERLNVLNEFV